MTDAPRPRSSPVTDRTELSEEFRDHYDHIEETRGSVRGPFGVLLQSPELGGRISRVGTYIRYDSALPAKVRELAIITTAREFDCAYEWAVHAEIAAREGVSEEAIDAILTDSALGDVPSTEADIVRFARELFRQKEVSETTFDAATRQFDTKQTTELIATMGYYALLACVLNGFEVLPEEDPFA